jgi:hypothetical protein
MSKEAAASQKDWVGYHPCSFFFYFYIYIIFLINRIIYHITILNFGGTIMSEQKQFNGFFDVMVDTINKWIDDYMSPVLYISDCLTERVCPGEYRDNRSVYYSPYNVITRVEWILNYKNDKKEYTRLILSRSNWYSGKVVWYFTQGSSLNRECLLIEENKIHMYDKVGAFPVFDKVSIMDLMRRLENALFFYSYIRSFDSKEEIMMSNNNEEIKTNEMSEDMRYLTQPTRIFRPTLAGLCINVHAPNLNIVEHTKIRQSLNLYDDFNKGSNEYSFNGIVTAVKSNGFSIEGQHAHGSFTINIDDVISGLIQIRLLSPANEDDLKLMNDIDDE